MSKPRQIAIALILAAAIGSALMFAPDKATEPMYRGEPLSYWLDDTHVPQGPTYGEREQAVRTIGTNAIPFLVEMIAAHEPPKWVRKIEDRLRRQPRPWSEDLNSKGVEGFRIFKTNAVSAVPALIEICERDYSVSSARSAIEALAEIGRGAQPALPMLVRRFSHTNYEIRMYALGSIVRIGGQPELIIPAATKALSDTNISVRWNALSALSTYGSRARTAVPEILKLMSDTGAVGGTPIHKAVEYTLWHIAPETVGKPLEIEMPAFFISEGTTTEAIKMDSFGERKILLHKGAKEPAIAQYWNSDPRHPQPFISVYRGAETSNVGDVLVGKFEVIGAPEKDANVSTLLMVVNGKTYLSARDVHNEKFLEIRKRLIEGERAGRLENARGDQQAERPSNSR